MGLFALLTFDPYNMGGSGNRPVNAGTPIQPKSVPRTISSDIIY